MRNDIRCALRSFRRSPVFTIVAVLSLALGIGANTAIFTLLDQALLQPLPVRDPNGLVVLDAGQLRIQGSSSSDNHETVYSLGMYRELGSRTDVFSAAIARGGLPPSTIRLNGQSWTVRGVLPPRFLSVVRGAG